MPEMVSSFSKRRFSCVEKAEECDLVLANVGVNVESGFGVLGGKVGEGGDGDGDVVTDAVAIEDGRVGGLREEPSAEMSDHRG